MRGRRDVIARRAEQFSPLRGNTLKPLSKAGAFQTRLTRRGSDRKDEWQGNCKGAIPIGKASGGQRGGFGEKLGEQRDLEESMISERSAHHITVLVSW